MSVFEWEAVFKLIAQLYLNPPPPPPPHRDSTPLPGCSLMKEPSQVEWNFIWRACD